MREEMADMLSMEATEMVEDATDDAEESLHTAVSPVGAEPQDELAAALERPAIGDLQTVAETFNTAFSSALYELELSRKQLQERAARIAALDAAVRDASCALEDEVEKGRRKESEYRQETQQLRQSLEDAQSERDSLRERAAAQDTALNERATEIDALSARIAELDAALEQRSLEGQHAQEEFARERSDLAGKLAEQEERYTAADTELKARQQELQQRNSEIEELRGRVEQLHADVESRDVELSRLNQQAADLQGEITAQADALRVQSGSHAAAVAEFNDQLGRVTEELEAMRGVYQELQAHAEKLENLNHALHESSITEGVLHKKQLDEKAAAIQQLRAQLQAAGGAGKDNAARSAAAQEWRIAFSELESKLAEAGVQNRELRIRAEEADRLEELNNKLRLALNKAREYVNRKAGASPDVQLLQDQVSELQAALETARSRETTLTGELQDYHSLRQEVALLRETAAGTGGFQPGQEGAGGREAALQEELAQLRSALFAAEEKCRQLEAGLTGSVQADCPGSVALGAQPVRPDSATLDRADFVAHLEALLAGESAAKADYSLMYLLLDNFITVRDEIGVMESEYIIKEVADIVASFCLDGDVMARFGDCTFAVLCNSAVMEELDGRANRIRTEIEARIFEYGGRSVITTASIGVCSLRHSDATAETVVSRADLACEAARLSGGNKVLVNSAVTDEITLTGNDEEHKEMIRKTLAEERIKIYYQPISTLREQAEKHYEILVRIVDESGKIILPGEFFSIAETTGQAAEVDRFIIAKVMQLISSAQDQEMKLFVKLTRHSVADTGLPGWIEGKIAEYEIRPEQLVFEVAESVMQHDLKSMATLCSALKAVGCRVAIEHYRLATKPQHLMHIQVDYLKIDSSLVKAISRRGESLAKVTAIMDLARQHTCTTIAEGVENPASLRVLWELGVGMAQGYFIQAPVENLDCEVPAGEVEGTAAESSKATFAIT